MKKSDRHMTPLEKLYRKRHEVRCRCGEEEERLSSEWRYLREHSGSLLVSGIGYLFYPRRNRNVGSPTAKGSLWQNIRNNLPFYLTVARESLSILRFVSRPFRSR